MHSPSIKGETDSTPLTTSNLNPFTVKFCAHSPSGKVFVDVHKISAAWYTLVPSSALAAKTSRFMRSRNFSKSVLESGLATTTTLLLELFDTERSTFLLESFEAELSIFSLEFWSWLGPFYLATSLPPFSFSSEP